jgi:hypothetical protein
MTLIKTLNTWYRGKAINHLNYCTLRFDESF